MKALFNRLNRGLAEQNKERESIGKDKEKPVINLPPLPQWPPQSNPSANTAINALNSPSTLSLDSTSDEYSISSFESLPDFAARSQKSRIADRVRGDEPTLDRPSAATTITDSRLTTEPEPVRRISRTGNGAASSSNAGVQRNVPSVQTKVAFISPPATPGPSTSRSSAAHRPISKRSHKPHTADPVRDDGLTSGRPSAATAITSSRLTGKPKSVPRSSRKADGDGSASNDNAAPSSATLVQKKVAFISPPPTQGPSTDQNIPQPLATWNATDSRSVSLSAHPRGEEETDKAEKERDENAVTTGGTQARGPLTEAFYGISEKETMEQLSTLPVDLDIASRYLRSIPVYPILLVVALSHASHCLTDESILAELKQALDEIISQHEHKPLSWLVYHIRIKAELQRIINTTHAKNGCKHMFLSGGSPDGRTAMPFALDTASLAEQTSAVLKNHNLAQDFLKQKGRDAQTLLDLLQAILLHSNINAGSQRMFRYALIKLAAKSGCYPRSLNLHDVTWEAEPFGRGGFGDLHIGRVGTQPDIPLAIKVIRVYQKSNFEKLLKTFASEVTIWSHLRHPNILPLTGVFQRERTLCIVSPYLRHGNIRAYLENNPRANRTLLALDIARALEFLHGWEPPIVHTDIKGDNILISDSERACLIDFGFSTAKDTIQAHVTSTVESARSTPWTAPEILEGDDVGHQAYTAKSDMYAFGGVCYELFCGRAPFYGSGDAAIIFRIVTGKFPNRIDTQYLDNGVWSLMAECWRKEPKERPTAQGVVDFFGSRASNAGETDKRPVIAWDYPTLDHDLVEEGTTS